MDAKVYLLERVERNKIRMINSTTIMDADALRTRAAEDLSIMLDLEFITFKEWTDGLDLLSDLYHLVLERIRKK